jgi:hypothetical protein
MEVQLGDDADILSGCFVSGMIAWTPNCIDCPDQKIPGLIVPTVFSP